METTEHWESSKRSAGNERGGEGRGAEGGRAPLADPLVWPRGVEIASVLVEKALEMAIAQDDDVIEALVTQRADEAFDESVRLGREDGGTDHADPCGLGGRVEGGRELPVVVAEKELGAGGERREVAKLLDWA